MPTAKLLETLSQTRALTSRLGLRGTAEYATLRLMNAVRGPRFRRVFLIVLSKPRPSPQAAAARNHTFHFASQAELESLAKDPSAGVMPWDLEAAADGSRCLLQLDAGKLVGYSWVARSPLIELIWGLHFNLPDDMAYNYNGFTAHAYRGTAFQGLRHLKVLEHLREEGKQRLFACVDDVNYRSLRGVEKSGYQRVGVLTGVKRGGKTELSLSVDTDSWSEQVRLGPHQHHPPAASKIVQ